MNSNPLDSMWKAYLVSTECFDIAYETIKQEKVSLFINGSVQKNAKQDIAQARQESNDLFVVGLWATFERFVISYLQNKGAILQHIDPNALANPIYEQFKQEVEYWKTDDILNLLKQIPSIDKNLIGQAKTIFRYRNWIAHGKDIDKASSISAVSTSYAYQIVNEIVKILLLN